MLVFPVTLPLTVSQYKKLTKTIYKQVILLYSSYHTHHCYLYDKLLNQGLFFLKTESHIAEGDLGLGGLTTMFLITCS